MLTVASVNFLRGPSHEVGEQPDRCRVDVLERLVLLALLEHRPAHAHDDEVDVVVEGIGEVEAGE